METLVDFEPTAKNKHQDQISVATKWFSDISFKEFVTNLIPDYFCPFSCDFAIR